MDWYWIVLIVIGIAGVVAKGAEENKKTAEEASRKKRAEDARTAILASGDVEAIRQLQMMDAAYLSVPQGRGQTSGIGSNALGTAAAVAGGMVIGNAVSSSIASAQLQAALSDIQTDIGATAASLGSTADLGDIDFDI